MTTEKSGTTANRTGAALERFIENLLEGQGYSKVNQKEFVAAVSSKKPIYASQFFAGLSLYGIKLKCDFVIYHPNKQPFCLIIEAKWQQAGGSVDEKYPYLVLNIKEKMPYQAILILDGQGYKPEAAKWLRDQVDKKLLHVFSMAEFQTWVNNGNI